MPIAGPISILITSNALKGRRSYCNNVAVGASLGDFVYAFIAVFCITKLYSYYKPFIPYLLSIGSIFLLYLGFKIFRTKLDFVKLEKTQVPSVYLIKNKERNGFYTGLFLNFFNPTLLMGWLASSFIIITFVSSLGFNTCGLDIMIDRNVNKINHAKANSVVKQQMPSYLQHNKFKLSNDEINKQKSHNLPKYFPLLISLCYAFFLALGSIIWFYYLTLFLVKLNHLINIKIVNFIINGLGIVLCFVGIFFGITAIKTFFR